jgi:hypothetical protein
VYINKYVNLRFEYKYAKAGTVSFADFPIHWPYPKPFGTAVLASLERLPKLAPYPKPFGTAVFASLKRHPKWAPYPKPGLPMLRIVFLGIAPYPKPFKQTRSVCLAFLTLIRSIKRA